MFKKNKQKNIKISYSCFEEKYRGWINTEKVRESVVKHITIGSLFFAIQLQVK